jgi:Ca2+-binding EF-hand superfamily protein
LDEFVQIDRLDDLAWAFFAMDGDFVDADYVDADGDGYISADDLCFFMPMMLDYTYHADDFFFSHNHAQLTVMMADRDGDGKLSMAEMQTIIDGSYMDDRMTPELSFA